VLALGRHIVAELQLDQSADTLGRWLAHHVAELIARAEAAEEATERASALAEAVDTILRIWQHRAAVDNRLNPLAELRPAVQVLQTLGRQHPPWHRLPGHKRGDAGWRAYQVLRRLTICLALLELEDREAGRRTADRTRPIAEHLSSEEEEIIAGVALWAKVGEEAPSPKPKRRRAIKTEQRRPPVDLLATVRGLIEESMSALEEIEQAL